MADRSQLIGTWPVSSLKGRRVLVVEDEYLLAQDFREVLERQGAEVMGPVPSIAAALGLIEIGPVPDLALLDINLQGEMVYPLADALRERGISFLFVTGYDAHTVPAAYADVPLVEKPVDIQDMFPRSRA